MPAAEQALPGRDTAMPISEQHFVNDNPLQGPFPEQMQQAIFGLGGTGVCMPGEATAV